MKKIALLAGTCALFFFVACGDDSSTSASKNDSPNTAEITPESVQKIIESAITYTTNFDLLTPPYDEVKLVSVAEMKSAFDRKPMVTGKRLGFRFQQDMD